MIFGNVYTHMALSGSLGIYENYAQKRTRRTLSLDKIYP